MKIHYLSSSTLISDSANSVHVMKICSAFSGLGHEVTLHGMKGSGADEQAVRDYYHVRHPFPIKRYSPAYEAGWLLNALKKIPFIRLGGLPGLRFSLGKLRHEIKGAELLFARNMYWLYGVRDIAPFVYETHAPPGNALKKGIESAIINHRNCRGVVVISDKLAEIYEGIFPGIKSKIIIAHDGADDPGEAAIAMIQKLAQPLKNVGYAGHIYQGRGVEIIFAMAKSHPDIAFHIVGGRADLIENYKKQGVPDNVIFHGHQPPSKLPEYFKNFDAVLAPYQKKVSVHGNAGDTSAFMSPLKIFEYMSWGLPILCSDMPVLREVLRDSENALMIEPDRADLWAAALERLKNDPALRTRIAQKARADFMAHYSWSARAENILKTAGPYHP